jgi:heptose I phosphotransferase
MGTIHLRSEVAALFDEARCVADFFAIDGQVAKHRHGRRTLRFERGGRSFFIKCHDPVGWREIIKELLQGRLAAVGAAREWRAIASLHEINVPTMRAIGYGWERWPAARQRSFLLTEELTGTISLDQIAAGSAGPKLDADLKRRLIRRMAQLTARLHRHGLIHRDLYLCHFVLQVDTARTDRPKLFVIDLHRLQRRRIAVRRWIVKDLAALYFSSLDLPPSRRDLLRFVRNYAGKPLRRTLVEDQVMWQQILKRGEALYRKEFQTPPPRTPTRDDPS